MTKSSKFLGENNMTIDDIRKLAKRHKCTIEIMARESGGTSIYIFRNRNLIDSVTLTNREIETSPFDIVNEKLKRML